MEALLTLILTFSIIVVFSSHATPTLVASPQPQMNLSSMLNHTQQHINETRLISSSCTYEISIKTSCNSLTYTTDVISILIGDANGNEIVTQLEGFGLLDSCMEITNNVLGHCIGKICKIYLTRVGSDGWMPETIIASHSDYPPITFNFNYFIPNDHRSGVDYCHNNA
ncbi:unnamed protein product [Trifolium pratense]|uniref:Uncharacterized protein n=1 Tax=Trifolium pratense TaxID=57577 RepID=A0ACB0KYH8_TRIPR|nr:unnamed protein product [Trifolium pratense]